MGDILHHSGCQGENLISSLPLCLLCRHKVLCNQMVRFRRRDAQGGTEIWAGTAIWVFDRGIVSEEDLGALHTRLKVVEGELLEGGWTRVRDEGEATMGPTPMRAETNVLCRSRARREKEHAMRRRFSTRMGGALKRLIQQVESGRVKDRPKPSCGWDGFRRGMHRWR